MASEITFDDAPQLEQTLHDLFKPTNARKKMKDTAEEDLDPTKLTSLIKAEIDEAKEEVTEDEAEDFKKRAREKLAPVIDAYLDKCSEHMKVVPGESKEEVDFKTNFGDKIKHWIGSLFKWLLDKIEEILARIVQKALTWCLKKVGSLLIHFLGGLLFSG